MLGLYKQIQLLKRVPSTEEISAVKYFVNENQRIIHEEELLQKKQYIHVPK